MSAAEIIEQINHLDETERRKVLDYLLEGSARNAPAEFEEEPVKYIPRELLEKTADEIFTKHETLFRKLAE